ncbi:LytTR family DNA-binding domain-containing protein [Emticicia sp. BO119]|uniref:LytR/AlgR family response regulator transcription factor n=1 Tax=Emticicia sp. BO119 TaxID=2757768 RepID=UPI0015F06159|nr:LytTR family DNA-binding domain-containing protein [Emticicia sp. BO119]MBA4852465.1 response regulator transcription factor [Emticicia sp. BO119]
MNIKCIIVEDEPLARTLLEQYIQKVPYIELAESFSNPLEALDFLHQNSIDLLISDIQMPELTGISLLKILPVKPLIILTTAYPEYALEGYELDVMDYLLKPVTFERFLQAIEKAQSRLMTIKLAGNQEHILARSFIFVKDRTKQVKIKLEDIIYVEGLKDYIIIYTKDRRIVPLQTLKSFENQLPSSQFIRIHNSYIVSFDAIEAIDKEKVQIIPITYQTGAPAKTFLPISDTYRKAFKEFIERKTN